jgi:hypothetical protein
MCNCSAKKAGKIIGGFAGITTLFSVIVMIIAAVTLQYRIDPETMQKCPNSKGAYTTTCGTKRRLGEVHNLQTIPSVSFPSWSTAAETAAYFEDAMQATIQSMENHKKENVETKAENTRERSLRLFEQLLGKEKKTGNKARLLAAQNSNDYSDNCTTANDGECDDPTKQLFVELQTTGHSTTCSANTDTTDCGELLEGSVCEVGKCCCKCGSSDAEAVDTISYEASKRGNFNYCFDSDCTSKSRACGVTENGVVVENGFSVDSRYIVKPITPTCINTEDVTGTGKFLLV